MAHTPGPWNFGKRNIANCDGWRFHRFPISGSGQAIASVWDGSADRDLPNNWGEANARLIAAAPDLLAALKAVLNDCDNIQPSNERIAREAIAKAEG